MKIIEMEGVAKKYLIGHEQQNPYASLKEILTDKAKYLFRYLKSDKCEKQAGPPSFEEFWALKNINFLLKRGIESL